MATAFGQTAHKWRGRDWSQERSDFKIHSFQLSNNKKQTTQFRNGQRIWIDISPKWYTNGQQAYEKMLNITNHYRNANQNHHEISLRIHQDVYYKKKRKHKRWWWRGQTGTLGHCWWERKVVPPLWKTAWQFLKRLKTELPYWPTIPFLGTQPKELKAGSWKDIRIPMFNAHQPRDINNLNSHWQMNS